MFCLARRLTRGHMYKLFPRHKPDQSTLSELCTSRTVYQLNTRHFSSLIQLKNFINSVDLSIHVIVGLKCYVFNSCILVKLSVCVFVLLDGNVVVMVIIYFLIVLMDKVIFL